ncbi:hypothetical protein [Clostridium sp. HBUAS56010]|uniref:hypothetical protein n=1 Tax=Clostridium sp. HBUAS56010 TaxID=2571127 RepID=UPI0011780CD7|nr:hypothetical protein [Clostridium sp. HBUAS56010]
MRIGLLLEGLINIAQTAKTDFAISMNMTPSGLSKILKGGRLPFIKEKRLFSRQAAAYFAEVFYSHQCYTKLFSLFPVIYDFNSKYELEIFLSCAIEHAIDKDFEDENDGNPVHPDREATFLGKKNVLNLFCVIVSDYLTDGNKEPLEFYSTLPFMDHQYSDIFSRIRITDSKKDENIPFYQFLHFSALESVQELYHLDTISSIANVQKYLDLNLLDTQEDTGNPFLLLRGQYLLLFGIQLDGTPMMTFITQKSYLNTFYTALMRKGRKKISYSGEEAKALLSADSTLLSRLTGGSIDAIYNFIPIGYLVRKEELISDSVDDPLKDTMLTYLQNILTEKTRFYFTIDSTVVFQANGLTIIPLLGTTQIPQEERIDYLKRFNPYISQGHFHLVSRDFPNIAVICSKGMSIVYLHDNEQEKIHYFQTDILNRILKKEIADNTTKSVDFHVDLWNIFLDEMSKDNRNIAY